MSGPAVNACGPSSSGTAIDLTPPVLFGTVSFHARVNGFAVAPVEAFPGIDEPDDAAEDVALQAIDIDRAVAHEEWSGGIDLPIGKPARLAQRRQHRDRPVFCGLAARLVLEPIDLPQVRAVWLHHEIELAERYVAVGG